MNNAQESAEYQKGILFAFIAYGLWGIVPVYFKLAEAIDPAVLVSHRILWSLVLTGLIIFTGRRRTECQQLMKNIRVLSALGLAGLFILVNWLVFIWAVQQGRIIETSLGYYINPLVSIVLGMLFLGERLDRAQWLAVFLAAIGTMYMIFMYGHFPWVSLVLAFSFGFYGLIRKKVNVGAVSGLFLETLMLSPLAMGWLYFAPVAEGFSFFNVGLDTQLLLVMAGVVTATPLLAFASAARRLPLATIGFFQYLAPSIALLLAVFVYGEAFTQAYAITFGFIWTGLIIYSLDIYRRRFARKTSQR